MARRCADRPARITLDAIRRDPGLVRRLSREQLHELAGAALVALVLVSVGTPRLCKRDWANLSHLFNAAQRRRRPA